MHVILKYSGHVNSKTIFKVVLCICMQKWSFFFFKSPNICKHNSNKNCTFILKHTDVAFHYSLNQIFRCSVWFGWNVNYSWFTCIHNCMTFWKSGRLLFFLSLPFSKCHYFSLWVISKSLYLLPLVFRGQVNCR